MVFWGVGNRRVESVQPALLLDLGQNRHRKMTDRRNSTDGYHMTVMRIDQPMIARDLKRTMKCSIVVCPVHHLPFLLSTEVARFNVEEFEIAKKLLTCSPSLILFRVSLFPLFFTRYPLVVPARHGIILRHGKGHPSHAVAPSSKAQQEVWGERLRSRASEAKEKRLLETALTTNYWLTIPR